MGIPILPAKMLFNSARVTSGHPFSVEDRDVVVHRALQAGELGVGIRPVLPGIIRLKFYVCREIGESSAIVSDVMMKSIATFTSCAPIPNGKAYSGTGKSS